MDFLDTIQSTATGRSQLRRFDRMEVFMTEDQAESIVAADQIGMYDHNYPGARSKLAHARLLLAQIEEEPLTLPCTTCDEREAHGCLGIGCTKDE